MDIRKPCYNWRYIHHHEREAAMHKKRISLFSAMLIAAVSMPIPVHAYSSELSPGANYTRFSLDLLNQTAARNGEENTVISPLSVGSVIGMIGYGADGETLQNIESVEATSNEEFSAYLMQLSQQGPSQLISANSFWNEKGAEDKVKKDYIFDIAENYMAGRFSFKPGNAVGPINKWIKKQTKGMLRDAVDKDYEGYLLYLVNTEYFDAKWQQPYKKNDIHEDKEFTNKNGGTVSVDMLCGEPDTVFSLNGADGFLKYYKDEKYAFLAILPKEGEDPENVIEDIDPLDFLTAIQTDDTDQYSGVHAEIPKFTVQETESLDDIMKNMGLEMTDMDLGRMYSGEHMDLTMVHGVKMKLDENGTKAAAFTLGAEKEMAAYNPKPFKEIILNRPFVYGIISLQDYSPVFLGVMNEIE